ncbi:MAG: signal transduction histidine kinase [Myxococcota bacterium]
MSPVVAVIDKFLPKGVLRSSDRRGLVSSRALVFFTGCEIIAELLVAIVVVGGAFIAEPSHVFYCIAAFLMLIGVQLLLLARFRSGGWSRNVAGRVNLGTSYAIITAMAVLEAGTNGHALFWYATLPMLALAIVDHRESVLWAIAAAVAIAAILVAQAAGVAFPSIVSEVAKPYNAALTAVGVLGLLSAYAIGLGQFMDSAIADLEVARSTAASIRVKNAFLATMSHELRTPLYGVIGMAQVLEASDLSPGDAECVAAIRECGEQLSGLVTDSLDVAAAEDEPLQNATHDASDLLGDVGRMYERQAASGGLTLRTHVAPDTQIRCDATRVTRVLHCLVDNAIKFTERGSIDVSLVADASTLVFEVADTGPGVPNSELTKIFKAFATGKLKNTLHIPGAGLGLAVCRRFAQAMGGDVGWRANVPGGSIFYLAIPQPPEEAVRPTVASMPSRSTQTATPLASRRLRA